MRLTRVVPNTSVAAVVVPVALGKPDGKYNRNVNTDCNYNAFAMSTAIAVSNARTTTTSLTITAVSADNGRRNRGGKGRCWCILRLQLWRQTTCNATDNAMGNGVYSVSGTDDCHGKCNGASK